MKINIFDTFSEAKEAQEYDHLYQKAVAFSTVSGVDLSVIRDNNLHIIQNGVFPLESYIIENNIEIEDQDLFKSVINYWKTTFAWSSYFKYENKFGYIKDHSDRNYVSIDVDVANLIDIV